VMTMVKKQLAWNYSISIATIKNINYYLDGDKQ